MTNDDFITVNIDRQTLLDMLSDRLDFWPASSYVESPKEKQLFMDMYESSIDAGCFDGYEFDPVVIVDNDVVNYCSVIDKADMPAKDWRRIVKLWHDGERDISCEDAFSFGRPSFIEAMNEEDREDIVRLAAELSVHQLAKNFGVSRRLVQFILHPERHEENLLRRKARSGSRIYYDREKQTAAMRRHSRYKQKLYKEGKIKI